jgi:hypothetical protein
MDYPIETLKNNYKKISNAIFKVGENNGQIIVGSPILNREGDINIYLVDIRISDQGTPPMNILSQVIVQIKDVNERPIIKDQKRQIRENSPIDSKAGAPLIATDIDLDQELDFTIQNNKLFKVEGCSGTISVKEYQHETTGAYLMNYEDAINFFKYTITVTDNGRLPDALSASAQVFIQLTNVPEKPTVESASLTIDEGADRGVDVGTPIQASDVDHGQTETLKYSISSGNAGKCGDADKCPLFSIGKTDGQIKTAHAGTKEYVFQTNGKSGSMTFSGEPFKSQLLSFSSADVQWVGSIGLNIVDERFDGYWVEDKFQIWTWVENEPIDTSGTTNLRVWVGQGDVSEYVTSFKTSEVGSSADVLDYELRKVYDLIVTVVDSEGLSGEAYVQISVTDRNDSPTVKKQFITINMCAFLAAKAFSIVCFFISVEFGCIWKKHFHHN